MNTTSQNRSVAIHVSDLHQSYGSFEAVRGVSFTVAPGELFALMGTNGAGKTTTIETLEGFRRPTRGSPTRGDETAPACGNHCIRQAVRLARG